jgi:hypothetical protein
LTTQNSLYKPANGETGWGDEVAGNFETLDRPELLNIAATAWHLAATLGALLDDLYSRYYLLATTTTYPVTSDGDDVTTDGAAVFTRM